MGVRHKYRGVIIRYLLFYIEISFKNRLFKIDWWAFDGQTPLNLCSFKAKLRFLLSQPLQDHWPTREAIGLPSAHSIPAPGAGPMRSILCWLSVRSQWLSTKLRLLLLVSPALTLLPFCIPVLIIGSLSCHQPSVFFLTNFLKGDCSRILS